MEGPEKEIFEEEAADIGELSINSQMEVQSPDKKSVEAGESSQALAQPQSQGLTASQQIVSQFQGYYNTYKRKVVRGPPLDSLEDINVGTLQKKWAGNKTESDCIVPLHQITIRCKL